MSSKKGKTSTVPKFSSFKSKPEITQPQIENKSNESRQHSEKRDRHDSVRDASHHTHDPRHVKVSERPPAQEQDSNVLFVHDKRGDPLIRRYGGLNRREIPAYRRFGQGRVLGADGYMRIDQVGSRDEFSLLGYRQTGSLLGSHRKNISSKGGYYGSQPIRVRQEKSQTAEGTEEYVSLRSSRKRKRHDAESEHSSGDEEPSYRSIYGKSKNHEHSDSDLDYASDASADTGDRGDPVKLKSIDLSRRVRDHPEDIDAWLELVNYQDTLLRLNAQDGRHPTAAEVKSFADIKLSMLEKAYSHTSTDTQREKLQLRIMREGSKIWDPETLSKRWTGALGKHETSFELWNEYTNFQQSKLSAFQYDRIKQLYVDRLRSLEKEVLTKQGHPSDCLRICEQMIYVFSRATRFISDAGYRELATAAWQASLELTFARPLTISNQSDSRLPSSFQQFWEDEVPRMGEEAAQGWAAFDLNRDTQEPPEPKNSDVPMPPSTRDGYKAWAIIEQQRALAATNPARTLDDGAEDDPFRVIMIADIQDILLYFPLETISSIRRQLIDVFLIFCRLPPAFCSSDLIQDILQDDFLIRSSAQTVTLEASPASSTTSEIDEEQSKKPPEFTHSYYRMTVTPEVLFPSPHWFKSMRKIRDDIPLDQYRWISTTLKQLTRTFGVHELGPYYLAFESVNEPGNEKKIAKALLKQDSTNLDLYLGYSMIEWAKGNKDVAVNTIAAAKGLTTISIHDKLTLGIAAAWIELEDSNMTKSILHLCALSDDSSVTPTQESISASTTQILKSRQFLSSNRDYLLSSGDAKNAITYAEGLALLEYLTQSSNKEPSSESQGDIWSAMASISTCSEEMVSRGLGSSSYHERLLQSAARLLYYHARQG